MLYIQIDLEAGHVSLVQPEAAFRASKTDIVSLRRRKGASACDIQWGIEKKVIQQQRV
jgi:hypothetical protein